MVRLKLYGAGVERRKEGLRKGEFRHDSGYVVKQELFETAAIITQTSSWQEVVNVLPSLGQLDH